MGSSCSSSETAVIPPQIDYTPFTSLPCPQMLIQSHRFCDIQKLKTSKTGMFRLLMSSKDSTQLIDLICSIQECVADTELYQGTQFSLNRSIAPLIDPCLQPHKQVYHQILTADHHPRTMKLYPFTNYQDDNLKNALYETYLYLRLSPSPLIDYFIISRGRLNVLVMIFQYYESSLLDIVRYREIARSPWSSEQLMHIAFQLLKSYRELNIRNICHRDIRLGKIFYSPQNNGVYELGNLESARVYRNDSDLLTVKGIKQFAGEPLKRHIENGNAVAHFSPDKYDLACIGKVILSLAQLKIVDPKPTYQDPVIMGLVRLLFADDASVDNGERYLRNFKWKNESSPGDKAVSLHLCTDELQRVHRERIEEEELFAYFELHRKVQFQTVLIEKINKNESQGREVQNVAIFHRMGSYYENIGVKSNDFYKQECSLLLELAETARTGEFEDVHLARTVQSEKVFQKLSPKCINNSLICSFLREKAYCEFNKQLYLSAQNIINEALEIGIKNDELSVSDQLKLMEAKAIIMMEISPNTQSQWLQKGHEISLDRNEFSTARDQLIFKSRFQYFTALRRLRAINSKGDLTPIEIGKIEGLLGSAQASLRDIAASNQVMVLIANCLICRADLYFMREDYVNSRKSLQNASNLLKSASVGNKLRLKPLTRLKAVLEREGDHGGLDSTCKQIQRLSEKNEKTNEELLRNVPSIAQKRSRTIFVPFSPRKLKPLY